MVKNIDNFSRGPRFYSKYPHGGLQLLVIPVLGDPTPSADLHTHDG